MLFVIIFFQLSAGNQTPVQPPLNHAKYISSGEV